MSYNPAASAILKLELTSIAIQCLATTNDANWQLVFKRCYSCICIMSLIMDRDPSPISEGQGINEWFCLSGEGSGLYGLVCLC